MLAEMYILLALTFMEWLPLFGLLIAILVAAFVAVVIIKRHADPRHKSSPGLEEGELTTDAIERMREQGTISQAEYEVMRQIVIGKTMARTRGTQTGGQHESETESSPEQG